MNKIAVDLRNERMRAAEERRLNYPHHQGQAHGESKKNCVSKNNLQVDSDSYTPFQNELGFQLRPEIICSSKIVFLDFIAMFC